ncbi:hypothetical protein N7456_000825 [Penicillium angulare]|uniref:Homologous-pairing protein 2 winged helix domain-containing protein n=1 Tax=Penicillium angulare TaxID=116970 RepID=A0A9W9KRA1_9EURO|nr:hypothetical protein N7456_000825 [Penicillium angulare]
MLTGPLRPKPKPSSPSENYIRVVKLQNELPVVYHALQDPSQSVTPEIITTVNESIEKLQHELSTIKAEEKTVRAALAAFEAKPRLSDLRQSIERLKEERNALQAKLPSFQEGAVEMQPQEREKLEQDWKQWQRHTTLRRRMCQDLWGKCTEILPDNMTLQELWESLGLEGTLQ